MVWTRPSQSVGCIDGGGAWVVSWTAHTAAAVPRPDHHHTTKTTKHAQLLSPTTYIEMARFDPIGAGFMLSIDDDGYFTVSSDPRVRACVRSV